MQLQNRIAYFLFFLFPFLPLSTYFEKITGTSANDYSRSVKQLADGSIYIFGDTDSATFGKNDFSLTKFDKYGNQLWTKYYGSINSENGFYLNTTADGNLVFVGETVAAGDANILIYKVDTSGTILWNKSYATAVNESATYIEQTKDGGYIVSGSQNDSLGYYDLLALKLDSDGNYQWHRTYGPGRNDYAKMIHETTDGFILVGDTGDSLNNYDVSVLRLDTLGKTIWSKNYGDSLANGSQGVINTSDGNYLFYGETQISPGSRFDAFLKKIDPTGNILWEKKYGGTEADAIFSVIETSDGGFACTGYSNSYNNHQPLDVILLKTDASGNFSWQQTYGRNGIDIGYEIIKSIDTDGYIITGKVFTSSDDCYLLKLDADGKVTAIPTYSDQINTSMLVTLYPNPASENISIAYELKDPSAIYDLVIYDVKGGILKSVPLDKQKNNILTDIHELASGTYFCSLLENNKAISSKKFIVK